MPVCQLGDGGRTERETSTKKPKLTVLSLLVHIQCGHHTGFYVFICSSHICARQTDTVKLASGRTGWGRRSYLFKVMGTGEMSGRGGCVSRQVGGSFSHDHGMTSLADTHTHVRAHTNRCEYTQ